MIIREFDEDYLLRDLICKKESGKDIKLNWKYSEGSHFFICFYDRYSSFDVNSLKTYVDESKISDEELVTGRPLKIENTESGFLLYGISSTIFARQSKEFSIQQNKLVRGIQYGIQVFVGEYDDNECTLTLFAPKSNENEAIIPINVKSTLRYIGYFLADYKVCELFVDRIDGYQEGSLEYHISGIDVDYPLPSSCLGRKVYIRMPKDSELSLKAARKYQKYYGRIK